jgi:hypothetical protein
MATRRRPERLRSLLTVLLLVLLASACDAGSSTQVEEDPEQALRAALEGLADDEGHELLVRFSADEEAQAQVRDDRELTQEDRELLFAAGLSIRATAGEAEADGGTTAFLLTIDDTEVAELRALSHTELYLRVDLDAVRSLVDDPEASARLDALTRQAEALGIRDAIEAARRGDWVRVTGLEPLHDLLGGTASAHADAHEARGDRRGDELWAAALRFVDEDVTVSYVGSDDTGDRVRATTDGASLRAFLDDLDAIAGSAPALGGAGLADLGPRLEDVADDATVSFDAWIADGRLTRVMLDLGALDDEGGRDGELLIVVDIAEFTGSIDVPEASAAIDLVGLLGGSLNSLAGPGPDPGADDASADGTHVEDGECVPEKELDELRSTLDADERDTLDEAIELGVLPVC